MIAAHRPANADRTIAAGKCAAPGMDALSRAKPSSPACSGSLRPHPSHKHRDPAMAQAISGWQMGDGAGANAEIDAHRAHHRPGDDLRRADEKKASEEHGNLWCLHDSHGLS